LGDYLVLLQDRFRVASYSKVHENADRVCRVFGCPHYEHLFVPQKIA
jgi:hypothetical protein